jgi:diguanylate cyclase (GGDEF)-like protein
MTFPENFKPYNPIEKQSQILSTDFYQQILDDFFNYRRTEFGSAKHTIETKVFDAGLRNPIEWTNPNGVTQFHKGLSIYNRLAHFHTIKENIFNYRGVFVQPNSSFVFIDIAKFSAMNIPDKFGTLGGDYYIKIVSQTIKKILNSEKLYNQLSFSRYGGDEFLIYSPDLEKSEIATLYQKITEKLGEVEAFYLSRKVITRAPIHIKPTPKIITIPENKSLKRLFLTNLQRNLILDTNELNNIIQSKTVIGSTMSRVSPKSMLSSVESMEIDYPDFSKIIKLAKKVDGQYGNKDNTHRLQRYFRDLHNDPMFDYPILPFNEFDREVSKISPSHFIAVDCKFIKEINDSFSIVKGDQVIQKFVDFVTSLFQKEELDDIIIGRRGGTLKLAIPDLSDYSLTSLNNILKIQKNPYFEIDLEDIKLRIPFGFSKMKLNQTTKRIFQHNILTEKSYRNIPSNSFYSGKTLASSEVNFQSELISLIQNIADSTSSILEYYSDLTSNHPLNININSYSSLLSHYFCGIKKLTTENRIDDRYINRLESLFKHQNFKKLDNNKKQDLYTLHSNFLDN